MNFLFLAEAQTATAKAAEVIETVSATPNSSGILLLLLFVLVLSAFLGFELIQKVPSQLHTPLMSGSNAISGITMVGALLVAGMAGGEWGRFLGFLALILATINVVGGYLVTDRMLGMFKKKGS